MRVIIILLLSSTVASAQSYTWRNASGQETGRAVTNNVGTQFYDASGRNTGRSVTNNAGTTFYDNMGRQTGRSNRR
jgi:hypothetical protein